MAKPPPSGSAIEPLSLNPNSILSFTTNDRTEIDTSSPFVSVREATNRFGGFGFWKPHHSQEPFQVNVKESVIIELKRQATELQNVLIVKECETHEMLKELEATKATVTELNSKLLQEKKNEEWFREEVHCYVKPAGCVLKDLSQAKMSLCKRTVDLAGLRSSVEVLKKQVKEEKDVLEKTRERVKQKSLKVEEEVRVRFNKKGENNAFKSARSEAEKAMAEIEETREKIKTVEMRLVAARKMKEAARAGEAVAMAEIKGSESTDDDAVTVTISAEEYAALALNARDAEEEARKRVEDAMSRVEEANVSKMNVLKKVEEAGRETETRKKALEEAMERADTSNATKLEAEEALRSLKLEKGQRRRSVNNISKFKTTTRTNSLMDVNGLHLTYEVVIGPSSSVPVLKPTMSIGQILSKKLLVAEVSDMNVASERKKMSLGQMLAKSSNGDGTHSKKSGGKENGKRSATSRKSFGFAKIAVLLIKESKNKKKTKKIALNLR